MVLEALLSPPFEPLDQTEPKWLSAKVACLLAMASAKRVSDLHALSVTVSETCIHWFPGGTGVTLWPNPYFLPKRLPSAHLNQVKS